jgi:hypothetical protein
MLRRLEPARPKGGHPCHWGAIGQVPAAKVTPLVPDSGHGLVRIRIRVLYGRRPTGFAALQRYGHRGERGIVLPCPGMQVAEEVVDLELAAIAETLSARLGRRCEPWVGSDSLERGGR